MITYPVNDCYACIQGEGVQTGVAMVLLDATRLVELISDRTGLGITGEVLYVDSGFHSIGMTIDAGE